MKIDKTKPTHWLFLVLFGLNVLAAMLLRPIFHGRGKRAKHPQVVLYGHKLSGNLLAIYRQLQRAENSDIRTVFLTMDPVYHRQLQSAGERSCLAISPACIALLIRAQALISDHGLHAMQPLTRHSSITFFDVWHGIPFKGFDENDFRIQHRYKETWVASPRIRDLYINQFGFDAKQVVVTGYARTDPLVKPAETPDAIRQRLGLERTAGHKLILFAPTWKQDAKNRSLFPFGIQAQDFMNHLSSVCRQNGALLLFRAHLNASDPVSLPNDSVIPLPFAGYPDTEAVLQISDVLICDWSSIAFDFLLLDRPTLFLDVEPPFSKGFSLGPEYRFGPIIASLPDLLEQLQRSLAEPDGYWSEFGERHRTIREQVYGEYADGQAAQRGIDRLTQALAGGFSQ